MRTAPAAPLAVRSHGREAPAPGLRQRERKKPRSHLHEHGGGTQGDSGRGALAGEVGAGARRTAAEQRLSGEQRVGEHAVVLVREARSWDGDRHVLRDKLEQASFAGRAAAVGDSQDQVVGDEGAVVEPTAELVHGDLGQLGHVPMQGPRRTSYEVSFAPAHRWPASVARGASAGR